tara:strand:+ start:5819 stop:6088 length:270 start_codon:yes stop_codon:yes gene_type:complete
MVTEVVVESNVTFNGKKTDLSFEEIKVKVDLYGSFSGSINAGNTMFLFNNVKSEDFQYYVDTFKKHLNQQTEAEVTFDIQTNAIETITI